MGGEEAPLARLFKEGDDDDIRRFILLLRPPELADVIEATPEDERVRVLRLMNAPLRSEVLRSVEDAERDEILEDLSAREIAEIVHESKSDDAADLVGALPPDKAERTLEKLEAGEREGIQELLEYEADTAGGIMQTEVVTVAGDLTVGEAIEAVRTADVKDVGEILEVFVVDSEGRLAAALSPADLLQEDPAAPLRAILDPSPVTVPVTMDQEQIAEIVRENDLAAVPVVDADGVLVGQILHDDIVDVIREEATEDIAKMAGADPDEVYSDRFWPAVRSRIVWLLPPFIGGLTVSALMSVTEDRGRNAHIIAAYLVVVVGMAGGVSTQNAALAVRSLALGRVTRAARFIARHVLTGLAVAIFFSVCLFLIVSWREGWASAESAKWSVLLGAAIFATMSLGAVIGVTVPVVLHKLGADPAVAAGPFIQTVNDVLGAFILIGTAALFG